MIFEYIRKPDGENLLRARESFKYAEDIMVYMGWGSIKGRGYINRRLYRLYTGLIVAFTIYVPVLFVQSLMWTIDISHADTLFTTLEVFFSAPAYTIRSAIMLHARWRVDKAKDMLDVMSERLVTHEERVRVHRLAVNCNYITLLYRFVYTIPTSLNLVYTVYNGYPPLNLYNPFVDWHKDTRSLWIAALYEYFIQFIAIHAFIVMDSTPLIFGLTVRSYTQWLTERVERLRNNPKRTEDENYQELVQCIKDHQLILDYSENMRPLISRALFVQYATASLVMAATLVHLVAFADMVSGITTTIYMISSMFQTFPFSYICEQIVEDCELLSMAIFHSNWIGAPTAYTSALKYFIHRTQQPIQFIAGGVFLICLNVNIQVAKFAFSLTTLVQQMSVFENFDR